MDFCASPWEPLLSLKLPSLVTHHTLWACFLFHLFLEVSHPCPMCHCSIDYHPTPTDLSTNRSLLKGRGHVTALWSSAMLLHIETRLSFSRGDLRMSFSSAKNQLTLRILVSSVNTAHLFTKESFSAQLLKFISNQLCSFPFLTGARQPFLQVRSSLRSQVLNCTSYES